MCQFQIFVFGTRFEKTRNIDFERVTRSFGTREPTNSDLRGLFFSATRTQVGSPFSETRILINTCSKLELKFYPESSVSETTQKQFSGDFRVF
jgi:hypothetical protein